MTEEREIIYPKDVLVQCPMKGYRMRAASLCEGCEHFKGLQEVLIGDHVEFENHYRVSCAHPIGRKLIRMDTT